MNSNRIYGLDLVRSIAILLVLFLHMGESVHGAPAFLRELTSTGWAGVDIFFVLSGYLIGSQIYRQKLHSQISINFRNFWVKRWFRTLPLYFVVLLTYVLIKPFFGWKFNDSVFKYFIFLQNYLEPRDFVQSWSLCIEEQFYVLFPIIVFLFPITREKKWVWGIPIGLSLLCRALLVQRYGIQDETTLSYLIRFPTYTHLDGIGFGVLLAFTQENWQGYIEKNYRWVFWGSLAAFLLSLVWVGKTPLGEKAIFSYFVLSLFSSGLVMSGLFLKVPRLIQKPVFWIATLSYGMYLWNNLLMRVVDRLSQEIHWSGAAFFFLASTALVSFVTYLLFEKPFMRLRRQFLKYD